MSRVAPPVGRGSADPTIMDLHGRTPIDVAESLGSHEIAQMLREHAQMESLDDR